MLQRVIRTVGANVSEGTDSRYKRLISKNKKSTINQAPIIWLLPREARFPSVAIHVRFLVDKVGLRFFFKYFDFSLPVIILTVLHIDIANLQRETRWRS
jgi:hypothetical protein